MAYGQKKNATGNANGRKLATQQSVDQAVKTICDIMRRGNCAGAMQYVPELTWILFLRILDEKEYREEQEAKALAVRFQPSLEAPFRWATGPRHPTNCRRARPTSVLHFSNHRKMPFLVSSIWSSCLTLKA